MGTAYTNLINDNATVPATYNAAVNVAANNFLSNPVKFSKFPIPQLEFNYNFELTQNVGW
jgi:1-deoxy-D-xylulose 5-phosphate reductoisomerase